MSNVSNKQAHDYELIAMSWHEASHVICGLYNFMKVYNVYVMSDKHEHGNAQYEIYNTANVNNKLLAKILIIYEVQTLYAGLVGERIYYKDICGSDAFPMHLRIGSSMDIQDAAKLINKYNLANAGKQRFEFKKQIQSDVKTILVNYWEDVKLISHMLYKHKELKYDELKYLLTRRSVNKDFWKTRFKEIKILYNDNAAVNEKAVKDMFLKNAVIM